MSKRNRDDVLWCCEIVVLRDGVTRRTSLRTRTRDQGSFIMAANRRTAIGLFVEYRGGLFPGQTVVVRPARRGEAERFPSWLRGGQSFLDM